MFTIHVQKIEEGKTAGANRLTKSKGAVEQYPSWGDWENLMGMMGFRCKSLGS